MHVYLVGGAVRDSLLGIHVNDRDWVVVGETPERMLRDGFIPVGKDFPVFLHPRTKEEYALARTEKKTGVGYKGFDCFFAPEVTLEEDLLRRDLTINAIAQTAQGTIIDPYHGQQDIEARLLRHVSASFAEDPVRVLRVARFAAKFAHLDFRVAPETLSLMQHMVQAGELSHLTPERVWQEFHKALSTPSPQVFLSVLRECGALAVIFPEIERLFGVPQPEKWHPEIDTGLHTLMVTQQASILSASLPVRFAAIMHDLGKGLTPKEEWPSHKKHGYTGLRCIKALCQRLKVPTAYRDLALLVCEHHTNIHNAAELRASTILNLFNKMDVWRKPERLTDILLCCQADHQGRLGFEEHDYPQKQSIESAYQAAMTIDVQHIVSAGFQGQHIREELNRRRTQAIKQLKSQAN